MEILDCRGLECPLPTVELTKKIKRMKVGEELEMVSNEPNSKLDVPAWCKRTGNQLIDVREEEGHFYFHIKKVR
ncbi:MAG TPA: sulfurtransferase TusA family protein [Methanomassiliicoccales archaeon]|jgi:tRNA 2-thiouridine synthesizing protein A